MILTNYLGVVFTAMALSANDSAVVFVHPEDGATNTLAWTRLSEPSQAAVSRQLSFAPVPPVLAATFRMAVRELRRIDALAEDGRLEPVAASTRRAAVFRAFERKCRGHGVSSERLLLLRRRLREKESLK